MGVVVPRRHPERRLLRIVGELHADDGFVADAGLGIAGDGHAGAEIASGVAVGVDRDRQAVQIDVLAQHLDFLDRAVLDHDRAALALRHLPGEKRAHLLDVADAERRRLAVAVLDQDVGEPPVRETLEVVEHQRPGALRTQIADLGERVDLVAYVQDAVVYGLEKRP